MREQTRLSDSVAVGLESTDIVVVMAGANEGKATGRSTEIVELTRVQPFEAEVIVARLRGSGIVATVGPESVYESLSFASGVPIYVSEGDFDQALALLNEDDRPE